MVIQVKVNRQCNIRSVIWRHDITKGEKPEATARREKGV